MSRGHFVGFAAGVLAGAAIAWLFLGTLPASPPPAATVTIDPEVRRSLARLEAEIAEVKARLREAHTPAIPEAATLAPARSMESPSGAEEGSSVPPTPEGDTRVSASHLENELRALLAGRLNRADLETLLRQIRVSGDQDAIVAAARALVEKDPSNASAHYLLAKAYGEAFLVQTSVAGMEKWGDLVMSEYDRALALDSNFWEPRFEKAEALATFGDEMGTIPDAIQEYETLRQQQHHSSGDPRYAQTYIQLARLYLRVGRPDQASSVVAEGLSIFPDESELRKLLDTLRGG